ncbi:MAG: DNA polymerase III subunit delta' [Neisseriales bacterium]|nr:MAG: DNA polymerase III subunit delta' [Neisseriales bacterium]
MKRYPWQEQDWQTLTQSFNQRPNAWLFYGQPGIGKEAFAKNLAAALLCQHPLSDQSACMHCNSCHWFQIAHHPDFYEVTPFSEQDEADAKPSAVKKLPLIKIESILRIRHFAALSSHQAALRIVLITPTEAMTIAAANALLKILEEPPPSLLFLLVSHHKARVLPTIRSRCRPILLTAPTPKQALDWLKTQKINNPEQWLALRGGSPLLTDEAQYLALWEQSIVTLVRPTILAIFTLTEAIEQQKVPLFIVLGWLEKWLLDVAYLQNTSHARFYQHQLSTLQSLAQQINRQALWVCYDRIKRVQAGAFQALNTRLQIEAILMDYRQLFARKMTHEAR